MTVAHLPTRPGKFFDPTTEVHFDESLDTWHVFRPRTGSAIAT